MYSNQKETGPSDYQWFNSPINSDYQVALLTNLYEAHREAQRTASNK